MMKVSPKLQEQVLNLSQDVCQAVAKITETRLDSSLEDRKPNCTAPTWSSFQAFLISDTIPATVISSSFFLHYSISRLVSNIIHAKKHDSHMRRPFHMHET